MKISVYINPRDSVRAGYSYGGDYDVEVSVDTLTIDERDVLASCETTADGSRLRMGPDWPTAMESSLRAHFRPRPLVAPTADEIVRRLAAVVEARAEAKAARESALATLPARIEAACRVAPTVDDTAWPSMGGLPAAVERAALDEVEPPVPSYLRGEVSRAIWQSETLRTLCDAARARVEARRVAQAEETARLRAAREAENKAAVQAYNERREAWVREHGSARLRLGLDVGMIDSLDSVYEDERAEWVRARVRAMDAEVPSMWAIDRDSDLRLNNDVVNPSEKGLRALAWYRKHWRECGLDEEPKLMFAFIRNGGGARGHVLASEIAGADAIAWVDYSAE